MRKLKSGCWFLVAAGIAGGARAATPPAQGDVIVITAPGGLFDSDEAQPVTAVDIRGAGNPDLLQALSRSIPGLSLQDAQGNPAEPNLVYRGFTVSPLQGQPQGLAVYVDGVRFNQPFGDTVHFELLPSAAIRRFDMFDTSSVYGLNALGGAVAIETKTGRSAPGEFVSVAAGDRGRSEATAEAGFAGERTSAYVAVERDVDPGWRRHSPSALTKTFADLGWDGEGTGIHFKVDAADTDLTGNGPAPVELLDADYRAVFTTPDNSREHYLRASLHPWLSLSGATRIEASLYWQDFHQRTVNGDAADIAACNAESSLLCLEADDGSETPLRDSAGQRVAAGPVGEYGVVNRSDTATRSAGVLAQLTDRRTIAGAHNVLVIGVSFDGSRTAFDSSTELGSVDAERAVEGLGPILAQPDGTIAPVSLIARTQYEGAFLSNRLALTKALTAELGLRWNAAIVDLDDRLGTAIDGHHRFSRVDPGLQLDWQAAPAIGLRIGYSEANRAPTPAELGCASASDPCSLTNFFLADPALKQVVARSFEIGGQGSIGKLKWTVTGYRSTTDNDIQFVASPVRGRAFFENVGSTRRQGIEAMVGYRSGPLSVQAGYAFTDASFRTPFVLNSPDNPEASENGQIAVRPGDELPGIPRNRALLSADYGGKSWSLGGDVQYASGQYYVGDEANLDRRTGAYTLVDLRGSVALAGRLRLFGEISNLLDARYATYGTFAETDQIFLKEAPGAADPHSVSPGPPRRWLAGLSATF